MPTTVNLKNLLDRPLWETCAFSPSTFTTSHVLVAHSGWMGDYVFRLEAASNLAMYDARRDGWASYVSPALGSFAAGACMTVHPVGPSGTVSAATATSITTNLNLQRGLNGAWLELTGGTGAGQRVRIVRNTLGASSVITVASWPSTTPDATTTFRLITPRIYMWGGGTLTTGTFRVFDVALNTTTTIAQTGGPANGSSNASLLIMPSYFKDEWVNFDTGTATAGGATTLTCGTKNWTTNSWSNSQVRISAGTGAGQIRTIASNTATVLTVSSAWTVNPDATSQFQIQGNDDFIYMVGNAAVGLFRYSISGNAWASRTARGTGAGAGHAAYIPFRRTEANWTDASNIQNGRFIYSFRGGAVNALDIYDIALDTWSNGAAYSSMNGFNPTTGWFGDSADGRDLVIISATTAGTNAFKFNPAALFLTPGTSNFNVLATSSVVAQLACGMLYTDGSTELPIYYLGTPGQQLFQRLIDFPS